MFDIITLNILKLINKVVNNLTITNKINSFNLNSAYQTINKLKKIKKNNSIKQIKSILLFSGIRLKVEDKKFYFELLNLFFDNEDLKKKSRIYLKNFLKNHILNNVGLRTWLKLSDIFYLKSELV